MSAGEGLTSRTAPRTSDIDRREASPDRGDHPDEDELCEMVALSPVGRCATMCLFGCISLICADEAQYIRNSKTSPSDVLSLESSFFRHAFDFSIRGCRSSLVRRLSFYPPFPAGYSLQNDQLYIQDSFHGTAGGRGFCPAGDEQLTQRLKPREGQESIQELLARNHLPERVRVCMVPRGRRKKLAAVLLWTTAGVPGSTELEDKAMEFALSTRQLVIFSHGNSTDIGYMFGLHYRMCFRCRVNVLAYDYSGYGWSDGKATEAALYKDVQAVYKYAISELKVAPHNIILYGHSVGSGPSCDFAARRKHSCLGGVVLHSSIASGLRLFINNIDSAPWFDAFRNVEKLRKVNDIPMLLIHGRLDRQVPFSHSLKLESSCREADALREKAVANDTKCCWQGGPLGGTRAEAPAALDPDLQKQRVQTWWVANADHNDVEHKTGDDYYQRISAFLDFCAKWHGRRHGTASGI